MRNWGKILFSLPGFGIGALAILTILVTGCSQRQDLPPSAEGKTIVVTTIFPLADWARKVGGDRVYVEALLPPGASPHTFDAGPRERRLISHAALFFQSGLGMDDWGASLAKGDSSHAKVVDLGGYLMDQGSLPDLSKYEGEHIADEEGGGHDHVHHGVNPHFWLDPRLAIKSVEYMRDRLIEADPEGKALYEANTSAYIQDLVKLDQELQKQLEPYAGSSFVCFHNAWPYFAWRYRLKIAGVIEEYAGKSPSERYLRKLTDTLKAKNISTIFSEPQLNPAVAETIAGEVGGQVRILDPYGTEGNPDTGSYTSMMLYNMNQLIQAFSSEKK